MDGEALEALGVSRDKLFLTTKIDPDYRDLGPTWAKTHAPMSNETAFDLTTEQLETDLAEVCAARTPKRWRHTLAAHAAVQL